MYRLSLAVCIGLAIVWNPGCSGDGKKGPPPAAPVKGTINLDGNPVPTGEIHFGMLGVPPKVLTITDGAFSGEAPVGENQVEVYIYEEGPPAPTVPDEPTKINVAPAKYWGPNTELKATVTESGPNEFSFEMTSG